MENILQAESDIDAVYTHDDDMAQGVVRAIRNANRDDEMFLTGVGGSQDAMEQIKEGGLYRATFLYNPNMAGSAVNMARLIALGEGFAELVPPEVPRQLVVPAAVVTQDNVATTSSTPSTSRQRNAASGPPGTGPPPAARRGVRNRCALRRELEERDVERLDRQTLAAQRLGRARRTIVLADSSLWRICSSLSQSDSEISLRASLSERRISPRNPGICAFDREDLLACEGNRRVDLLGRTFERRTCARASRRPASQMHAGRTSAGRGWPRLDRRPPEGSAAELAESPSASDPT